MLAEIKGQIERITYYNEENGYTIAKVKVGASAPPRYKDKNSDIPTNQITFDFPHFQGIGRQPFRIIEKEKIEK